MPLSSCPQLFLDHSLGPTETLKSKTLHLANFVKHIKKKQNKTKELSEPSLKRSKRKETTLLPK